jgi:hypothetical protein
MPASELLEETNPEQGQRPRQIASWTHLVGFLLIGAGVVALGSLAQHALAIWPISSSSSGERGQCQSSMPGAILPADLLLNKS